MELLAGLNHSELHHYDLAGRHLRKAHFMCPNRFEPLYYQAKGLMSQGKYTDAERLAKTIIQKKVKVPSEQIDQIKKEMYEIIIINNKPLPLSLSHSSYGRSIRANLRPPGTLGFLDAAESRLSSASKNSSYRPLTLEVSEGPF